MASTGHLAATPIGLPFHGVEPIARHCSHQGAVDASERAGRQALALLALYRQHGPLTDREAARRLDVERTTINARRNELVKLGLVTSHGSKRADTGIRNTLWGLT
jgi:predicted ArsR family transcriptional regulator